MTAQILMKLYTVTLLVVCFLTRAALDSKLVNVTCSQRCRCYKDTNHRISAKCDINGLNSSHLADMQWPEHLISLDLSSNSLKELPVSFLRKLSNISTLDISNSNIRSVGKELPKLENLFVKQSHLADRSSWHYLLSFPRIKLITSVRWTNSCEHCNISRGGNSNVTVESCHKNCSKVKMSFSKGISLARDRGEMCWYKTRVSSVPWFIGYDSPSMYLKPGFTLQCMCDPRDCTTHPPLDASELLLRLVQLLFDCLYPLAAIAITLNAVIILLVSTSKELRKSPTMLLVLNMAMFDLFMGIWCVLTATFNTFSDTREEVADASFTGSWPDRNSFELMCPYMAFIFGVTQFVSVLTSLFLSIERYLVITCCMKPYLRITKKTAIINICIAWFVAIVYHSYAVFLLSHDQRQSLNVANTFICTMSGDQVRIKGLSSRYHGMPLSVFFGVFYILTFLITLPLYIHMYIVVRKSSTQMGVKREGALARKLALLVLTNLLFSTIPLSLVPLFSSISLQHYYFTYFKTYNSYKVFTICSLWLPVLLLCLNSYLNPFLFAFRHHSLRRHFQRTVQKILHCFNEKRVATADHEVNEHRRSNRARQSADTTLETITDHRGISRTTADTWL